MKIAIWHFAFCRWYDHDRAGHPRRAQVWGVIADKICLLFWPIVTPNLKENDE